VTSFVSDIYST